MNELSILDSIFNDIWNTGAVQVPRVDVKEDESTYTFEMDLPGRCENDVNIELDHDKLSIASAVEETKEEKKEKSKTKYLLKERTCRNFERSFRLPEDVDADSISANFKNGVLTISMNKKAIAAPKKIMIEAV